MQSWLGDKIYVLKRVCERHPNLTEEDVVHAWKFCIKSMLRIEKEPEEWVGIGYDLTGRLVEIVALRSELNGAWLIKHAQTPPQEKIKRELGFGRRK